MKSSRPIFTDKSDGLIGPYDSPSAPDDLWFLPDDDSTSNVAIAEPFTLAKSGHAGLLDAKAWRAAEAALAADLAALAFDYGRLSERVRAMRESPTQRLALAEASSLSWWTGDRVSAERLALWQSYRIGAADAEGGGLIRTAWAARRLAAAGQGGDAAAVLQMGLGEGADRDLIDEVAQVLGDLPGLSAVTQGCALLHLWRSLDERPEHLRGLEAAVLGARLAAGQGMAFLPLTLTGFSAVTASGAPEARLTGWITGAHRAVLAALMMLERLAAWRARADAATSDLQGRTPGRLITALAAHPMLGAAQAEAETGASRAAVQRNLDVLTTRGLAREVTGQGRFRVWAARV
ncbi:MAG: helix-turn-helix domain-containing protein [Paracoccaceae bacterium]